MSEIVEMRDSWLLFAGNTMHYLNYLRDTKNVGLRPRAGRMAWPDGKHQFADFVTANGGRVPPSLAIVADGRANAGASADEDLDSFLEKLPPGRYFCKRDRTTQGIGAFTLDISESGARVNGEEKSLASLATLFSARPYIIQASLTPSQHPSIARFNGGTINTLRLVTFETDAGPAMFAASLRMATANPAVDNWSAGGVMVPVDIERGVLEEFGTVKKDLAKVAAHPQSGVPFGGQSIPYFREAAEMACRLHRRLNLWSVGWDIALLNDGPCMIEANRKWSVYMAQRDTVFLDTFFDLHLSPGQDAATVGLVGSFARKDAVRGWLSAMMGISRVSARVDYFSHERMAVTLGGSRAAIERAMKNMEQSVIGLGVSEIRGASAGMPPLRGLDIGAMFSP